MKVALLQWLACPHCRTGELGLTIDQLEQAPGTPEVLEGLLKCTNCGALYPIVDGIPRMLPDSFLRFAGRTPAGRNWLRDAAEEIAAFRGLQQATADSFSFEWLRYQVTGYAENCSFFDQATGLHAKDLAGQLVLDAGCGMGRFLEVAAGAGAEVIGMDLSRSVERARRETRHADHVHFVQGDILRPPFRPGVFGVVYSLGVLHHTPGTRAAFAALCPLLREGGRISIWVYPTFAQQIPVAFYKRIFARLAQGISDGTRLITTRLPRPLLHYLCYLAVPVGWLKRLAAENRGLKYLLWPALLAPVSAHREWRVRLCDTFDWLAPPYQWKHTTQEVLEWFREAGLEEVRPLETPVSATGCKGARKSKPAAACQTVDTSVYAR